jgi:hypothetical protein
MLKLVYTPAKKIPFLCRIGMHLFVPCGNEKVTAPPRGPFDPRSAKDRTRNPEMEICCSCGKKREREHPYESISL